MKLNFGSVANECGALCMAKYVSMNAELYWHVKLRQSCVRV